MDDNTKDEVIEPATISPLKFEPLNDKHVKKSSGPRPRTILISLALFVCASIAFFLFTARAVYFEAEPASASIEVNSLMKFKLADRYLLLRGQHDVSLQAEGYYPLDEEITVSDEQNQYHRFTMKRLPGHLQVDTGAVTGAEIFVDDLLLGQTPTTVRDIEPGTRQLKVSAERYFPFEETVEIEGLDITQQLKVELVPAWAEVSFSSTPAGAEILVDDEAVGNTPFTAEILEGKHQLKIKLPGHKAWKEEVLVKANEPLEYSNIQLEPADALVFLASNPPRASATMDGEYKGLTPLELTLKPGKSSTIRLFKEGYQSASRTVNVASGEEKRLLVNLAAELVEVEFRLNPADARLLINGKTQPASKRTIQLPAKKHRIEVRREGYLGQKTEITPRSGVAQVVKINLKSERQAKLESIKPLYTTSSGESMKLFYPGSFTMGASRREPGRRANETIRDIVLKRPFYMSLHEVTNGQFRKFRKEHNSGSVQGRSINEDNQPVVKIGWDDAARYCNWLSKAESLTPFYTEENGKITGFNAAAEGYRLPSEAEWAWAARLTTGKTMLKFPWGAKMPPAEKSGNFADVSASNFLGKTIPKYNDGYLASAKVGSFPANSRGLFDMGGNVSEWVNDFYDIQLGAIGKAPVDPLGPATGKFHVIRGSSWAHGTVTELRLSYRDYNAKNRDDLGFRIARYLE